ncbi:hypothetical protein NSTC731_04455 [Nostoc sp. DSM 114167]|jgi:hypothetical protein
MEGTITSQLSSSRLKKIVISHWSLVIGNGQMTKDIGAPAATLRERQGRTRRVGQITNLVNILSNLFSVSIFPFYNLIQIFLASKITQRG